MVLDKFANAVFFAENGAYSQNFTPANKFAGAPILRSTPLGELLQAQDVFSFPLPLVGDFTLHLVTDGQRFFYSLNFERHTRRSENLFLMRRLRQQHQVLRAVSKMKTRR